MPHPTARHDLRDRDDVEALLRDFYGHALEDPLLRPVFVDVAQIDLASHLPRITDFWERVLFDTGRYDGRTMAVHRHLHARTPLTQAHFARWLELWDSALERGFAGPVAEAAAAHARRIAATFLRNLSAPPRSLPLVASAR